MHVNVCSSSSEGPPRFWAGAVTHLLGVLQFNQLLRTTGHKLGFGMLSLLAYSSPGWQEIIGRFFSSLLCDKQYSQLWKPVLINELTVNSHNSFSWNIIEMKIPQLLASSQHYLIQKSLLTPKDFKALVSDESQTWYEFSRPFHTNVHNDTAILWLNSQPNSSWFPLQIF